MKSKKPVASLSLDLDDKWSYMKTHGDVAWESFPSYLNFVVPRILEFLKRRNLKITFFIVGQDAALDKNRELLKAIANAGHEIGNHSFKHEPWLHLYSKEQIESEIIVAEENIECATGHKPIGFRGPGYSLSRAVLQVLIQRGYQYDATTFPTYLHPLARLYYFTTTKFTPEQKQQRKLLGGTFRDGYRPIRPYRWQMDVGTLLEMPVTTMPFFRIPIHFTYLLSLSIIAQRLALQYFSAALMLCRLTSIQPSMLLHPTDFLGSDDIQNLSFIPGMSISSEKKMDLVSKVLSMLRDQFTVMTLQRHTQEVAELDNILVLEPNFPNHHVSRMRSNRTEE